jgi:hypothetical protein
MNLYIKKISTLAGVGVISILSTFQSFTNVDAALTAPASYDIAYTSVGGNFIITAPGYTPNSTFPLFTRIADGVYYDYFHDFQSGQHTNLTNFDLPQELNIIMEFHRSNTSWTDASIAGYTGYYSTDTKIGSDNTVGNTSKFKMTIDNQTTKNYLFYLDFSSTSGFTDFTVIQNSITETNSYVNPSTLGRIYIPSFTHYQITLISYSKSVYFDAWYLQDLGTSDSYDMGIEIGYDNGYADGLGNNPNILLNGFQAMVGILVNFMLLILNLEVFGVSILSVFSIVALFVGFIWILKIIRG